MPTPEQQQALDAFFAESEDIITNWNPHLGDAHDSSDDPTQLGYVLDSNGEWQVDPAHRPTPEQIAAYDERVRRMAARGRLNDITNSPDPTAPEYARELGLAPPDDDVIDLTAPALMQMLTRHAERAAGTRFLDAAGPWQRYTREQLTALSDAQRMDWLNSLENGDAEHVADHIVHDHDGSLVERANRAVLEVYDEMENWATPRRISLEDIISVSAVAPRLSPALTFDQLRELVIEGLPQTAGIPSPMEIGHRYDLMTSSHIYQLGLLSSSGAVSISVHISDEQLLTNPEDILALRLHEGVDELLVMAGCPPDDPTRALYHQGITQILGNRPSVLGLDNDEPSAEVMTMPEQHPPDEPAWESAPADGPELKELEERAKGKRRAARAAARKAKREQAAAEPGERA